MKLRDQASRRESIEISPDGLLRNLQALGQIFDREPPTVGVTQQFKNPLSSRARSHVSLFKPVVLDGSYPIPAKLHPSAGWLRI
jgi:hypothetical protein